MRQEVINVDELSSGVFVDAEASGNANVNGNESVLGPFYTGNDMSSLVFSSDASCSSSNNSTYSLFHLYINGLDFTIDQHPDENSAEYYLSSNKNTQNMLNPLANIFFPIEIIPVSPSCNFDREECDSAMEILLDLDQPVHTEYPNVSVDPSVPYPHNSPMTIVENSNYLSNNVPNFISPLKPSERLAKIPEVIDIDTPDLSLMSSFLEKEECVRDVNAVKHDYAFIDNYVFINGVEFGAYYFVFAISLIMALSVFLNPLHNTNCNGNSVSIKGWTEIYYFLTGQFSNPTPNKEDDMSTSTSTQYEVFDSSTSNVSSGDIPASASLEEVDVATSSYSSDQESPRELLQSIRLKNVDRIIIGHLNINSIRHKISILNDIIQDKIDIFLLCETKIDKSFPTAQFNLTGFETPYRLDRTVEGGGLLLYIRNGITSKPLKLQASGIECILVEITISKKKWLVAGIYNPHENLTTSFLNTLSKNLDHYLAMYDNIILLGDFNCEISHSALEEFNLLYSLKSLIKTPTCFKSISNPSCIDLILTNRSSSFQNSSTIEIGLSDFHHLVLTVLKTTFKKKPPMVREYRDYKGYNSVNYLNDINRSLAGIDLTLMPHDDFVNMLLHILQRHAPIKTKCIRGNDQPFMTKELRKEHMKRTRLLNKYRKDKSDEI